MARFTQSRPAPIRWLLTSLTLIVLIVAGMAGYAYLTKARIPLVEIGDRVLAERPDYTLSRNWAVRPDTPPPGGWEDQWGVDMLVLLSATPPNIADWFERPDEQSERQIGLQWLADRYPSDGSIAVYAPFLRVPSRYAMMEREGAAPVGPQILKTDMSAALAQYVSEDNRKRGLLILTDTGLIETLVPEIETQLADAPDLIDRFGGVFLLSGSGSFDAAALDPFGCTGVIEGPCVTLFPGKPNRVLDAKKPLQEMVIREMSVRSTALSEAMTATLPKPAPPLPPLELIEIAPINRPSESEF